MTSMTEPKAPETTVLAVLWQWRYHRLEVDWEDSLEMAVSMAGYAKDNGQASTDCIEVWDENGYRRYSADEVSAMYEERLKQQKAAAPPPKPAVAKLYITHPDGERVVWSTFTDPARADECAGEVRPFLGERVEIEYGVWGK